jgi:hypothetical protein
MRESIGNTARNAVADGSEDLPAVITDRDRLPIKQGVEDLDPSGICGICFGVASTVPGVSSSIRR